MASDADEHIVQGNLLVGQGQYNRAVAEYTEAIRIEPRSALAYMGRGVARAKAGRVKQAIADQTEAIRIDPRASAAAFRNRGRDHSDPGAVKSALADFTEAIRLEPQDAGDLCDRATVYNRLGKYALAIADANEGVRLQLPSSSSATAQGVRLPRSGPPAPSRSGVAATPRPERPTSVRPSPSTRRRSACYPSRGTATTAGPQPTACSATTPASRRTRAKAPRTGR